MLGRSHALFGLVALVASDARDGRNTVAETVRRLGRVEEKK